MKKFEKIQLDVLSSKNQNQLVSAGAGSGKTTVMIEKIANLLLHDNVDINSLLVVTFTVLAAQEMKDRLIAKVRECADGADVQELAKIQKLINDIQTASIDTIDGFNSKTIRKYFYELKISPNIDIISDSTRDYFMTKAMKITMDNWEKSSEEVELMIDYFGGNRRNLKPIEQMILDTYNKIVCLEDYDEFLVKARNEYLNSSNSEYIVNSYLGALVDRTYKITRDNYSNLESVVKEKIDNLCDEFEKFNFNLNFQYNLKVLDEFDIAFTKKELSVDGIREINKHVQRILKLKTDLKNNKIDENYQEINEKILFYYDIFEKLLKNFINNYTALKEKNNLIDFNDLNRLMLKLMENENISHELQEKYRYIFIDEYQDVNPLQDKLMTTIAGENTNVFMVGDVKQSIYGFRGASPEWFLNKYNKLKAQDDDSVFDMNVNFRSNPKILNFINELFTKLMVKETSDIDYAHTAMIEPKRDDIVDENVKIMLIYDKSDAKVDTGVYSVKDYKYEEVFDADEKQCMKVVEEITKLIGTKVYDANQKATRELTYNDIAILTHSEKDTLSLKLIKMLRAHAIPVRVANKIDVQDSETIKLIISILKCVIGTADDVDYLAAFLAITNLDMDDIASLRDKSINFYDNLRNRLDNDEVLSGFNKIEELKNRSACLDNAELINYILDDLKVKYFIMRKRNGDAELQTLGNFVLKLSEAEKSLSLCEFVDMIESSVGTGSDVELSDDDNSVVLETIHKSKGLEYPVVILFNASKMFTYIRDNDEVNINSDVGIGFDYFDSSNRTKCYTLPKFAIKIKNSQKSYKEELRLLYVALTRAKNKLYIFGNYTDKMLKEKDVNQTSFANMILDCFIDTYSGQDIIRPNFEIRFLDEFDEPDTNEEEKFVNLEEKDVNFTYKNIREQEISLKNTVTGLNSKMSETTRFDAQKWLTRLHQGLADENRASVGTHYHEVLEKVDYLGKYKNDTTFEDVDSSKIEMAYNVIHDLTKGAISVRHEADFMMYVPYNEIVKGNISDRVLIQGVIDLLIEYDDHFDILDYKFSSLPAAILKKKYAEQLAIYKLAVEKAYKKPVKNTFIYSINTGEVV